MINNNKDIKRLLYELDINNDEIEEYIKKWFKISWISKLALFYQDEGFKDKYHIIKKTLDKNWKRLDTRWTSGIKNKQTTQKIIKDKIDLNSLL
jgi:hypothetical protein